MTTTDAELAVGATDPVDLLLPNAVVSIRGLPASVADALGDLTSATLRPGPDTDVADVRAAKVDGAGVILAGASGSGKSTVAVELLQRGAGYLPTSA